MNKLKAISKLTPIMFNKIWGGNRISKLKNQADEKIGESWEISTHPDGMSLVGKIPIVNYLSAQSLTYLLKLIDTSDNLSVQVHPDDTYARKYEQSLGKSECWLILDAGPGCGIYLGLKKGVTKKQFEEVLSSTQDVSKLLNFYETKKGDFFYVPAGTIHAIGKDVFLCEVQQSSGITYRVWDWNRIGENNLPRQLHIKQALEVMNFDERFNRLDNFKVKHHIWPSEFIKLIEHKDFEVNYYNLQTSTQITSLNNKRMNGLICLEGRVQISFQEDHETIEPWESVLLKPETVYNIEVLTKQGCKILWVG